MEDFGRGRGNLGGRLVFMVLVVSLLVFFNFILILFVYNLSFDLYF